MKGLLVLAAVILGAVAEPPAPYPASGWRPSGPSFDLPQRGTKQQPQNPRYLPPLDPRNRPLPDEDVSVQGLPQPEPRPLFLGSPIAGQEYTGPALSKDLRNLDESFQQSQYQKQQDRYREYQRQKQLESQATSPAPNPRQSSPAPSNPRQFARTTEAPTTLNQGEIEPEKTSIEVTKQNLKEIPGELFLSSLAQLQLRPQFLPLQPVSSQSSAYTQPEGFDGPAHFSALPSVLAQQKQNELQSQPILVQQPISQFAQAQVQTYTPQVPQGSVVLQAPAQFQPNVYLQPNPNAVAFQPSQGKPQFVAQPVGFPQQPNFQAEDTENIDVQSQNQQKPNTEQFNQQPAQFQPQNQYQPQFVQPGQPQPQFVQPGQPQVFAQPIQPQTQYFQPGETQTQFIQPGQPQTQFVQPGQPQNQFYQPGQPQKQYLQPQNQITQAEIQYLQPQFNEPQNQYGQPQDAQFGQQFLQPQQNQFLQPQSADQQSQFLQPQQQFGQQQFGQLQFGQQQAGIENQYLQPQTQQNQARAQGQNNLQSGLDINQEGNDIDEQEQEDDNDNEGATAVATAFGTRTQPRFNTRYGAPYPVPQVRAGTTTTEAAVEEVTEGSAVAQAVAVANGERRKSARLRGRRVRPVYAVDSSGRLVLAEA